MGQHKIGVVIAVAFTCIAVIPTVFWAIFSFDRTAESIYSEQRSTTEYMINGIDRNIDIYFSEIKKITDSVFGADVVQNILKEARDGQTEISIVNYQNMQGFYTDLMGGRSDVVRMALYSGEKEMYANSSISFAGVYPSDQDITAELEEAEGRFVICGSRYYEYVNGKKYHILTVGRKIRSLENGDGIGYLLMDIDYKSLHKIAGIDDEEKDLLLICQPEGKIVFSSASDEDVQKEYTEAASYNAAVQEGGKEFVFSSDYYDWTYHIVRSNQESEQLLQQTGSQLILISVGICILILGASFLIAYSLTRPIHKLEDAMRKADLENYKEEIYTRTPYYEVSHLIYCYNRMVQRIRELMAEQKELLRKQAAAEYQALQMQITPHFLYNSLDSINCLAEIKNEPEISSMIRGLAHIFQYNMKFDTGKVTLQDEIQHVKNYCMLQAINYQDRFDITYDIPEDMLKRKVVKFMLQPLVENAISHGMRGKRTGGHIEISAGDQDGFMMISVKDNGVGMTQEEALALKEKLDGKETALENEQETSGHIAVNNVNRRLKYRYGDTAGVTFETEEGTGTTVTVHIPLEKKE